MKIGDLITDLVDQKWIIYDLSDDQKYVFVTDFNTQIKNEYLPIVLIKEVEQKPNNFQWLFIKRREKNLKGLEEYYK